MISRAGFLSRWDWYCDVRMDKRYAGFLAQIISVIARNYQHLAGIGGSLLIILSRAFQ